MGHRGVLVVLATAVFLCHAVPGDEKHGGSDTKCPLTVKVLDAVRGTPAPAITLRVYRKATDGSWAEVTRGATDAAGEAHGLIDEQNFTPGVYRVEFDTKTYWKAERQTPFHELADVVFQAHADGHRHYTLALLLSPFSYTTTAVVTNAHE
ncbi:transthyretin [Anguilla rostrata]|uniref:Transthyretin n=2 Tax=Anguilla anguilla TaxID=7936 RepID=A0A0E9XUW7_ANGAN|nr:transthyretin [Anguilla anguilla]